ncbi:MAG TPA: hypothetical protein VFI27_04930 [candidate division Zixibacteria bacterium]|nr:hypothetical protein [candidate division Zixibacteria bacterium]
MRSPPLYRDCPKHHWLHWKNGSRIGALIGAAVYRLLQFYLDRWFGEISSFLLGVVYIALVLFIPYGLVGTWRAKAFERQQGWQRLLTMVGIRPKEEEAEEVTLPESLSE